MQVPEGALWAAQISQVHNGWIVQQVSQEENGYKVNSITVYGNAENDITLSKSLGDALRDTFETHMRRKRAGGLEITCNVGGYEDSPTDHSDDTYRYYRLDKPLEIMGLRILPVGAAKEPGSINIDELLELVKCQTATTR